MTSFAPPDFVFNGIQFNSNFYDNALLAPAGGSIPNPLPVAELDTNTIQALNNVVPVNLYTTFTDVLTLGGALITDIIIESGYSLSILGTTLLNIGSSALSNLTMTAQLVGIVSPEVFFTNIANDCRFTFYPNDTYPSIQFNSSTSGGFQDASIEVNPKATTPTADFEGTVNLRGGTLKTPSTITSLTPSSVINLFTDQTASISLGNSGITLRAPNTIVGQIAASPQNLFTTTTGQISLGGASTLRLSTPNEVVSAAIATAVNLFNTQTGNINFGTLSSALALPLTIVTNSIASTLNLFNTQTGQINLGASSATLVTPNTVQSTAGTAQTLYTNQTANITLGGTSVPALALTGDALNLNSTNSSSNTVVLGSQQSTSNTLLGSTLYLNNTNGASNIVYVGGSNTTTSDIRGATVNVNSTYLALNSVNIGSSFSTINSYPISPNTGITYDGTIGTNIAGTIGYVYNGSFTGGSLLNSSLQTVGNINSLPKGVYMVTGSFCFNCSVAGQVSYQQAQITKNSNSESVAMVGICTGTAPGNCSVRNYFLNVSGIVSLTASDGLTATLFLQFTGGTFARSANSFAFRAVRIA